MATNKIAREVISEVVWGSFTNGYCIISGKTGYNLVNAYVVGRPTTETNNYAINSIYRFTTGDYQLENKEKASFGLDVLLIWAKA